MIMRLDHAVICFALAMLPLLAFPLAWLPYALGIIALLALFCLIKRAYWLGAMVLLILLSYWRVYDFANQLANQTAYKGTEVVRIVQLQKQQEYQTAIGERQNGERIYLTWQNQTPLLLERDYQITLNLRPVSGRLNIGNFDRQRWYVANRIQGLATVKQATLLESGNPSFRTDWLMRVHQQTENLPTQGLLLALAFGERAWLNSTHWQQFQQTGTAHLIAISGLHIALAFGFGFWLAKIGQWCVLAFGQRFPIFTLQAVGYSPYFARIVGFLFALGYSYLAGFAIPTQRALWAISAVLLCQFVRRHYTPSQLWWRIVAILLVIDPLSVLSDSFWLSILAVASLILWYRYFPLARLATLNSLCQRSILLKVIISLMHLQFGILLIFAPVQFFFFQGSSPFTFLANLLIVPLYSFLLVPLILFTLLTDNLLHTWQLADWIAQGSIVLITPMADYWLPLSYERQWHLLTLNGIILCGLAGWIYRFTARQWGQSLLVIMLFYASFYGWKSNAPKAEWVTFDVGQGLAQALVFEASGQKQAVFYDTGVSWGNASQNSMAGLEILPYLQREGIEVIAIFLSHDDNDHSGGVATLLQHFPQARLISSSQKRYGKHSPEVCLAGQKWQFGVFHLTALFPSQSVSQAKNQDSCILLVEIDRLRLLLTGDTGVEQERQWAASAEQVDFLQVPHHGSKTSSSETLLQATQPKVAVISAGRWNPWKLPNNAVVERFKRNQIEVLNTAEVGMVRVVFSEKGAEMQTARTKNSPWYQGYLGK